MSYAELHAISNFTFLRGASHPDELVRRAHELGYAALALTDECSLAGIVRAHTAARTLGLRLIVGAEFTLKDGPRFVALVRDRSGYTSLCRLITRGRRQAPKGEYHLVRADVAASGVGGLEPVLAQRFQPGRIGPAIGAGQAIAAIAEHLQAPVTSYRRGRGVVPSTHPLAVPVSVGHRLWAEADVVLAIGTRLFMQQGGWGVDAALKVVRIDIDALEPDRFRPATVPVVADAAAAAPALLERLLTTPAHASRAAEVAGHMAWMNAELAQLEPQMGFLGAIRAALPEDGIFVDEVTQVGFVSRLGLPVTQERTFLSPGYQDNLGWGYGTALGAQAVRPEVPVVSIAGDGGFLYQIGELATAVQHKLPVVVVVFDNNAFFNVKRIQAQHYGNRQIASDLHNPDFARLAETFGMASFRVTDAAGLERAVGDAIALKQPALVHVKCGAMPSPWHLLQMPRVRG